MHAMPKLVVFDCDGTLVDSHHMIVRCVQHAFERAGEICPSFHAIRDRVGLSLDAFVADLAPGLDPRRAREVVALYREEFARMRAEVGPDPLFEGIEDLLRRLTHSGVMLGVATGKSRRGLDRVLDAHDLRWAFVTLQTADDAPSKPHPAMVLQAIAEAGVLPHETVMVGDTVFDVQAAAQARAAAVGVNWGAHDAERLLAAGARSVANDVPQLAIALGVQAD